MQTLRTLTALPDLGDRRFAAVPVGGDALAIARAEHAALAAVAAAVMGVPVEKLTMGDVEKAASRVASLRELVKRPEGVSADDVRRTLGWTQ